MKLVVFAHTPPPHHGQSFMVAELLRGLGGDQRISSRRGNGDAAEILCFHVNSRFSDDVDAIGKPQWKKVFRAVRYSIEAVACRFRYGARDLYYVPASGSRAALYRDWIVMSLCRPFFRRLIYHWHSVGLSEWLSNQARPWERMVTRWLSAHPDLSLALAPSTCRDGEFLKSARVEVVPNGIPDPCPDCAEELLPRRKARALARAALLRTGTLTAEQREAAGNNPEIFRVLFLSLCYRPKGLFDAVEAVALLNRKLREGRAPLRVELSIAGKFYLEAERREFEQRVSELNASPDGARIHFLGFVSGDEKRRLFTVSDCFCFPSYYAEEGHPISLLEAMAFGLPIIATRWRALPDLFPAGYPGLVDPRDPNQLAATLERFLTEDFGERFRRQFETEFTEERFIARIKAALRTLGD